MYCLVTTICSQSRYIFRTTTRAFDNRKLVELTPDISKAKTFDSKPEALEFLSKCVTNDRIYRVEESPVGRERDKPVVFTDRANKARIS